MGRGRGRIHREKGGEEEEEEEEGGERLTYRPKRSAIQPLPTRPTTEPAYPIASRLLAFVAPRPCSMAKSGM